MSSVKDKQSTPSGNKRISRRNFLKMGATGAAGLAVAAATPALASAPTRRYQSGSPTVVRFWSWYMEQQDQFPKVISDFEAANPNIKIDLEIKTDVTGAYLPAPIWMPPSLSSSISTRQRSTRGS